MLNRIVVGTDGSENAGKAICYAGELAEQTGAELIVVAVDNLAPVPDELQEFARDADLGHSEIYEAVVQSGKSLAEDAGARSVSTRILTGDPASALVAFAEETDADLIVLGSRGLGSVAEILLGSISRKVLHMARRPSLIVP